MSCIKFLKKIRTPGPGVTSREGPATAGVLEVTGALKMLGFLRGFLNLAGGAGLKVTCPLAGVTTF